MLTCFECGAPADHQHHVVPRSKGGTRTIPLCAACHGKVHGHALGGRKLTKDALKAKRSRGEKTGGGVPFGYDVAAGKLVENQAEQRALRLIESLRAVGKGYQRIAGQLNSDGTLTKTGRAWTPPMVRKVYLRFADDAPDSPVA